MATLLTQQESIDIATGKATTTLLTQEQSIAAAEDFIEMV
jgi:hypothetical protein